MLLCCCVVQQEILTGMLSLATQKPSYCEESHLEANSKDVPRV